MSLRRNNLVKDITYNIEGKTYYEGIEEKLSQTLMTYYEFNKE